MSLGRVVNQPHILQNIKYNILTWKDYKIYNFFIHFSAALHVCNE